MGRHNRGRHARICVGGALALAAAALWLILLCRTKSPRALPRPAEIPPLHSSAAAIVTAAPAATNAADRVAGRAAAPPRPADFSGHSSPEPGSATLRFEAWLERYRAAAERARRDLEAEGLALAGARRRELAALIESDPAQALARRIRYADRRLLPASIVQQLEEPINARGFFALVAELSPASATTHSGSTAWRTVEIGDRVFRAFTHGRRLADVTVLSASIEGIAVDDALAVSESPLRLLDPTELADRRPELLDPVCRVSGTVAAEPLGVEVAGELAALCSTAHVAAFEAELEADEAASSPVARAAPAASSSYTLGAKRLLVIRVDFDDLEGEPFSDASARSMVSSVAAFYAENSYGRTTVTPVGEGSELTPTLRMPATAASYGTNDPSRLRRDARSAASAAGFTLGDYHFDLICFGAVPGFKFSGLGYVGAPGAWLRNTSSSSVAAHELGHNLGLKHANFWDTSGQSIIGPGVAVEYGDPFDSMGSAGGSSRHFNARYKSFLNWIPAADFTNVTVSGTYRLVAHDHPQATGLRGLRIARNTSTNYTVEYRQAFAANRWLLNGVSLRWTGNGNQESLLLDATPGSPDGKNDSALLIGRTFSDATRGIHITPIGKAGTTPEALDVVVNLGRFTNNRPPTLAFDVREIQTTANTDVTITAQALDADGDALAFAWDFGDGNQGPNSAEVRHRWTSIGEYLVRCVVSDMKGGVASVSTVVRAGNPTTLRISGLVLAQGRPVQGVRIAAASNRITWSDTDGRYLLVGLAPGEYSLRATHETLVFPGPTSSNPVRIGPSRLDVDFVASGPGASETLALVPAGAVWQYLDDGSDQGTAWRTVEFDDATWGEGPTPMGYGDDGERTAIRYGSNANLKHVTTYFRHRFLIDDPRGILQATLGLRRDDGAVVYVNGQEAFRSNLPTGTIRATTLASAAIGGAEETQFIESTVAPALFRAGENVLAVEIHQASRTSSDIVFDLRLDATRMLEQGAPMLTIQRANNRLVVEWTDRSGDWYLQTSPTLAPGAVRWTPLAAPFESVEGQHTLVLVPEPAGNALFVRLARTGQ